MHRWVLGLWVALLSSVASAQEQPGPLRVGDAAPPLAVGTWLRGEPVERLEPGTAYVVEFWSTWCESCEWAVPQLSRMQRTYQDQGLVCIGIGAWDDPAKTAQYVKDHEDRFGFRVATDAVPRGAGPKEGAMARAWLAAAGRTEPPVVFLVDRQGRVMWIGHPLSPKGVFAEAVEMLVEDRLGPEQARELSERYAGLEARARVIMERHARAVADKDFRAAVVEMDALIDLSPKLYGLGAVMTRLQMTLVDLEDYKEAYEWSRQTAKRFWDDAYVLNLIAWTILDTPDLRVRDLDLAMSLAVRADALAGGKNAAILDTLARAHFERGEVEKAIPLQKRAVELAEPELRGQLTEALRRYERALAER